MKYLSVCSGVEAASVAWNPIGFEPVAFSEIEKFPSRVLSYRYPHVPNLGDMTKYKEWKVEPFNILVGGTPCQSFSVAGLRKGLEDPRGNLMLTYVGILEKFRPKWCVWENVPGVLSSNGGRDFGSFLGALVELGYGFSYRVLDAQNFGVAQRRRRVFVVGCFGDWESSAKVLFESESLSGNIKARRSAGQEIARCLTRGIGTRLDGETDTFVTEKIGALCARDYKGVGNQYVSEGKLITTKVYETHPADSRIKEMGEVCQTVTSRWGTDGGNVPIALAENTIGREPNNGGNGNGFTENGPMYTLNATGVHGVANSMAVRRLTPIECERLQGFPDDYTNIPKASDGHRYKAMGNSMAVPVMQWLGCRIANVEYLSN